MKKSLVLVLVFLGISLASLAQANDSIKFISPVKSTVWKAGSLDTIKIYFKNLAGNYNSYVAYKKVGSNYSNYISGISQPGNTTILWNIYSSLDSGAYNVVLYDSYTSQYYYSDTFKILAADPWLKIIYPYNKTQIQAGNNMTISYASVYKDSINVQLSLDNGLSWDTLVRNQVVEAQLLSMCVIAIPKISGKMGILKISNYGNTLSDSIIINLIDEQVYKFYSPTDTSKWQAGSTVNIQFSKSDSIYNSWNIICYKVGAPSSPVFNTYGSQTGLVNAQATIDAVNDSGKYYLSISDYYTGQFSYSDTFTIKAAAPSIHLQQINGNYFLSGETTYISWSSISLYKIFVVFSKDGGNTWDTLASNLSSPNSYYNSAKIIFPSVNSTYSNCKIKIGSPGKVESNILGPITLSNTSPYSVVSPTKNNIVNAGSTYTVKFNSSTTNYCNVYYSGKGITSNIYSLYNTNGLNSFSWQVSQYTDSGKYRIAIYDQTFNRYFYGDTFYIAPAPASLTISSPSSNYYLVSGKQFNLQWNAINSGLINVVFSKDGGSTWDTLARNINSLNTPNNFATITAPVVSATYKNCILKIISKSGNVFSLVSNIIISDKAPYQFITPNDTTKWMAGNYGQIKFNNYNTLNNYWQISYQKIGGSNSYINSGSQTGLVSFNWNISSYLDSGYYTLVIYDQTVGQYYYSDTFYISPAAASLSIMSPGANYYLVSGETFTMSWNAINSGLIHAELSKDGGSSWQSLATNIKSPNTGSSYQSNSVVLKVPAVSKTYNNCLLRIMNNAQTAFSIITNIVISNVAPYQFISPTDTTKWSAGNNVNITFNNALNNYWTLYYMKIGNYTNYVNSNYQTGKVEINWNISPYIESGYYQMAIYDQTLNRYFYSDTFYVAPAPPSLNLNSPVSGSYYPGSSLYLSWAAVNSGPINIEISTDGGTSWDTIAKSVYSSNYAYNSYQLILPNFKSTTSNGILKISSQSANLFSQVSNLTFTNKLPHLFISPTKQDSVSQGSSIQIKIYNNKIDFNYLYLYYENIGSYYEGGINTIYTSDSVDSTTWYIPEN